MYRYTWKKLHAIAETLSQSGDKRISLEKALFQLDNIKEAGIPPKFRKQVRSIKNNLLPPENQSLITRSNNVSSPIQNLTEDEIDDIIHMICTLESFMNPN